MVKNKKIIVSSSNNKYFHLLDELFLSIKKHNLDRDFDFGVLDTGLSNKQKDDLIQRNCIIKKADWNVDVPNYKIRGRNYLKNIVARAFLPDYFQGYEKYIWLDADTWINHKETFLLFDKGCSKNKICITPQTDRSYGEMANVEWFFNFPKRIKTINYKNISRSISKSLGRKYAMYPTLNGGVFSINDNQKLWKSFQNNIKLALQKGRIFGSDQVALAISIFHDEVESEFLPAYTNWLCEFHLPIYEEKNKIFLEPYLPNHPIGVMHLAGLDSIREKDFKEIKTRTLEGEEIYKSIRFNLNI